MFILKILLSPLLHSILLGLLGYASVCFLPGSIPEYVKAKSIRQKEKKTIASGEVADILFDAIYDDYRSAKMLKNNIIFPLRGIVLLFIPSYIFRLWTVWSELYGFSWKNVILEGKTIRAADPEFFQYVLRYWLILVGISVATALMILVKVLIDVVKDHRRSIACK